MPTTKSKWPQICSHSHPLSIEPQEYHFIEPQKHHPAVIAVGYPSMQATTPPVSL